MFSKQEDSRQSYFMRLMDSKYAMKHWCLVFLGILASMVQGAILPLYGLFLSKMLFVLNHPDQMIDTETGAIVDYDKKGKSDFWCLMMFFAACMAFVSSFVKRFTFGIIGEFVTFRLRVNLFQKILGMKKKWFDDPRNQPANLISILSNDT